MIRDSLKDFKGLDHDPDFRWRGTNVTRIENLSDIAFAIALGMLISGVDAPRTLQDLREFLLNLVPTILGFVVLLGLWNAHYTFFRRYGVADKTIIALNAALIFVVLSMAYPLRFAFESLYGYIVTLFTQDYSRSVKLGVMSYRNAAEIITYFSLFFSGAFAILALMQSHVLKKAALLSLNPYELAVTRQIRMVRVLQFATTFLCATLAWFSPLGPAAAVLMISFRPVFWMAKKRHPAKPLMDKHSDT